MGWYGVGGDGPSFGRSFVSLDDLADVRNLPSDYDVFLSPLSDFKKAMEEAGLGDKVVYLDRKDAYRFKVKE